MKTKEEILVEAIKKCLKCLYKNFEDPDTEAMGILEKALKEIK